MIFKSNKSIIDILLIIFSILQIILISTVSKYEIYQKLIEIIIIVALILGISKLNNLSKEDFILLIILVISLLGLIAFNDDIKFIIISAKNNIIGVLSIIYFSKRLISIEIIKITFFISTLMILIFYFDNSALNWWIELTFYDDWNRNKFGGLFLNSHINTFFLALFLIYFGRKSFLIKIVSLLLIIIASAKTVLIAYIFQILSNLKINIFIKLIFIFIIILNIIYFKGLIIEQLYNLNLKINIASLIIIFSQLIEPYYYKNLINIFPYSINLMEYKGLSSNFNDFNFLHEGQPEVGFFSVSSQCGLILGLMYISVLVKRANFYTPFILVSLLHYNFIFFPLIIILLLQLQMRINLA